MDKSKLDNIKQNQQNTLDKIFLKGHDIISDKNHFDWWMFPIDASFYKSGERISRIANFYLLNNDEIKFLVNDNKFKTNYVLSIELMYNAYIENKNDNIHVIRLKKLKHSLFMFSNLSNDIYLKQLFCKINSLFNN